VEVVDLDWEFELPVWLLIGKEEECLLVVGPAEVVEAAGQLPGYALVGQVPAQAHSNIIKAGLTPTSNFCGKLAIIWW
jgi:hypothetical protein